jgi:hypothetical protein
LIWEGHLHWSSGVEETGQACHLSDQLRHSTLEVAESGIVYTRIIPNHAFIC